MANISFDLNKGTSQVSNFDKGGSTSDQFFNTLINHIQSFVLNKDSELRAARERLRNSQLATKGIFVAGNKHIKNLTDVSEASMLSAYATSDLPVSDDDEAEFLLTILQSSFFVISDQGQSSLGPLQAKVLNTLAKIGSLRGTASEEDITSSKEAAKAKESYTKSIAKLSIPNLSRYSSNDLAQEVVSYINKEALKWAPGQDFLGIPAEDFLVEPNIANLSVKRKIIVAVEDPTSPTKFIVEQVLNIVVKRAEDSMALDPRFQSRNKEAFTGEYETKILEIKETSVTLVSSKRLENAKKILKELRETTKEGSRLIHFGHVTSISTESLIKLKTAINDALSTGANIFGGKFTSHTGYTMVENIATTLQSFINILEKIDNLIFDLGASPNLPNYNDLKSFIAGGGLDAVRVDNLTLFAKIDGNIKKTGELEKSIELEGGVDVEILATAELAHINKLKSAAQTALNILFLQYFANDIGKVLSEEEIIEELTKTTASDSFITSVVKRIFGVPILKGKKKQKKLNKKLRSSQSKISNKRIKTQPSKLPRRKNNKASVVLTNKITLSGKAEGTITQPESLLVRLDNIITEEVMRQMNSSTLQNRSGRFANSVEILSILGNSIVFNYMRSPYDVFSRDRGKGPWNSRKERDPSSIINKAIVSGLKSLGQVPNFTTGTANNE